MWEGAAVFLAGPMRRVITVGEEGTGRVECFMWVKGARCAALVSLLFLPTVSAQAQRVADNAVKAADDAFGTAVGNERTGLYNPFEARGFSRYAVNEHYARVDDAYVTGYYFHKELK